MDVPHRQLACSIDGQSLFANADTGSEADLVSLEYANRRGWDIKEFGYVELADGSIVKLAGYVDAWLDVGGKSSRMEFCVLDGLQCDLLLGDETLHGLDAFNEHESLFVDLDVIDSRAEFHAIKWKGRVTDHVNQILGNKLPPEFESATNSSGVKRAPMWKRLGRKISGISPEEEMEGE
jgi:hypothetical protein